MLARGLRVQVARLLRSVPDHCLDSLEALLGTFLETATCRTAQLHWDLGALCEGGELGGLLLGQGTLLAWPLGALGVGRVPRRVLLALLLHHGPALRHVVGHLMHFLFSYALALVLS